MRKTNLIHSWVGRLTLAALGAFLIAIAAVGLIGRGGGQSASRGTPTHQVDFDVRADPTSTTTITTTTTAPTPTTTTAPRKVPTPVSVRIPAVGITSKLIPLGLNPDNTLEVPNDFSLAGW